MKGDFFYQPRNIIFCGNDSGDYDNMFFFP